MALKDILAKKIPKRLLSQVPSSFDILGNRDKAIAIIEIPSALKKYKLQIGKAILEHHKNVKTVLGKGSPRKGVFRIRDYEILAGPRNTEVVHLENGCRFLLDPTKVYFSQREGTERMRIASSVKNREKIAVFFAGVGPFPIILSKKTEASILVGIEINPLAVEYFHKNIILNKCRNVKAILGDVGKIALDQDFDRVVMPLPESSLDYLSLALKCAKNGAIINLYLFSSDEELPEKKKIIRQIAKRSGKKISFAGKTNVLPYGPRIWKVRFDLKVSNA